MTEHEELLMLRTLVVKQKEELAAKERIIEEQGIRIEKQNIQIENMIQALLHARKKLFGPSTEVAGQMEGQLSLFESVQKPAEELEISQKKITVKPHTRVPRQPGVRAEMLAGLPKEIEEFIIPADEACSVCGSGLKVMGKKIVRTGVEFIPAKLIVKQVVQQVAKCTKCGNVAKNLPGDFHGYLVTDAYAGYEKAEHVKRALCWSHCHRYFIESIPLDSRGKEIPGSKGAEGREYINFYSRLKMTSKIR